METKNNIKMTIQFTSILALIVVFFTFTQCVETLEVQEVEVTESTAPTYPNDGNHDGISGGDNTNASFSNEFVETGSTEVAKAVADVGIKDFEQIYRSMSVVTGIDPANHNSIRSTYGDLNTALPNENSVKQFNSSIQFAIFKLGSEFCDVMMNDSNYYNAVFKTANMGQGLTNNASKDALVQDLINHFWGVGVQEATLVTQTKAELVILVNDLLVGESAGNASVTRKVAKGVCASVIATPQITML